MPFVIAKTNVNLSPAQETRLKELLGKAMAKVPGKSEKDMLLELEDKRHMWLAGDSSQPLAYVDAALFGTEDHRGYAAFTAGVARAFSEVAGIAPERVFVRVEEIGAWSVGEQYIDRRWFQ